MFVCNFGKVQCIMFIAKSRKFASFKIRSEDLGFDKQLAILLPRAFTVTGQLNHRKI